MKNWIVTIEFIGLTGPYLSRVDIRARNAKSAESKARLTIGNRDGSVLSVLPEEEGPRDLMAAAMSRFVEGR